MIEYLPKMIHSQDEPIADWVCIPLYFVSKLAHDNGMKVVQVGEGSDEQFCGYAGYMAYLKMYHKYWSPFRKYLPQPAQRLAAGTAGLLSGMHPRLPVYADIIDRAARSREHFWSGAMVFPDSHEEPIRRCERHRRHDRQSRASTRPACSIPNI